MGINVLSEIGHARAGRGRLFTWPSSEHSQVPLAHITLRYSCHQALASGAERVRDTEQKWRETERSETEKKKKDRDKAKSKNWGKSVEIPTLFNSIYTYVNIQQAAAEQSNTAGPCTPWFCSLRLSFGSKPSVQRAYALLQRIDPSH